MKRRAGRSRSPDEKGDAMRAALVTGLLILGVAVGAGIYFAG